MKKTLNIKLIAALATACALAFPPAACADAYRSLSARIAKCAVENSLKKIAVLDFAARGGAGKSETAYVAEKMGVQLAGSKAVSLIERALLEKVLKEAKLSSAADGVSDQAEVLGNMLSVDAVVTGVVFAEGGKLRVFARLIDTRTGRVLLAAEGETSRLPPGLKGRPAGDIEPDPAFAALPAAPRSGFRDAVADFEGSSCPDRGVLLNRLNAELVDAKARYWALRMKAPGFNRLTLKRNPGSEIGSPAVKAVFYELLASYYETGEAMEPGKKAEVAELIKMETRIADECGLH